MTREEAIKIIQNEYKCVDRECDIEKSCGKCPYMMPTKEPILKAYEMAIKALSQEPTDAISREAVMNAICDYVAFEEYEDKSHTFTIRPLEKRIDELPSVTQKPNFCASCKHNTDNEICLECEYDGITRGMTRYESVTQKSGKWIDDGFYAEGHSHKAFHCSKCGHNVLGFKEDLSKYCPNCGAKMESEEQTDAT